MAQSGDESAERELFSLLTASFRIFTRHKIMDSAEAEDVVQDALTVVAQKYKGTEFVSSFAGWAHNVLRIMILRHVQTKAIRARLQPQAMNAMTLGESSGLDDELIRRILHCLNEVGQSNRRFARALNLQYLGFTASEISAKLQMRVEYLYVVMTRARSMLLACLGMTKD